MLSHTAAVSGRPDSDPSPCPRLAPCRLWPASYQSETPAHRPAATAQTQQLTQGHPAPVTSARRQVRAAASAPTGAVEL